MVSHFFIVGAALALGLGGVGGVAAWRGIARAGFLDGPDFGLDSHRFDYRSLEKDSRDGDAPPAKAPIGPVQRASGSSRRP